jgi:transposase
MFNRHIACSRISEAGFREVLRLLFQTILLFEFGVFYTAENSITWIDLQSAQIAKISGISRVAINRLLDKIRKRITLLAEKESCFSRGEIEIDESYFGPRRVRGRRGRGALKKTIVFGMKKRNDKVYTQIVKSCSAAELLPIIKRLASEDSTIYSDEWKAYDGLVDAGYEKHYRVKHSDDVFSNGKAHINGIESFGVSQRHVLQNSEGFSMISSIST